MPELPEVETIARELDERLTGARIVGVTVRRPDVLREASASTFRRRLRNTRVERCWRRAKFAIIDLGSGDRLVVQPRFTGSLRIVERGAQLPADDLPYSTMALRLGDGRSVHYCDVRRLGTVALMSPARFAEHEGKLGPEPLERGFTGATLSAILRSSRQSVKKVIMDQTRLAGVGNIYANEALWRAGIDPSRAADRVSHEEARLLRKEIVDVLRRAVNSRGTSFRDYRDASGEPGEFVKRLNVYGREGQPCSRCGGKLVGTHAIDGRATVLCVRCQR